MSAAALQRRDTLPQAIRIVAVGDIGPRRASPRDMFADVAGALQGDITFGQMECVVSDEGTPAPNARLAMRTSPEVAAVLAGVGFDVLSLAGNHAMDFGGAALIDTVAHLRAAGIATCGAGPTLQAARQPAIVEAAGRRVAFLAYNAILPHGYAAEPNRPGCAPLRVHTVYEPIEPDQPGTDPRVLTFVAPGDLAAILDDVRSARERSDHVIVSMHWGIHFVRAVLAQYQHEVGRAVIDAGADAIIGHHPHLLKGIAFHRGRPIIHSMGNFAIEQPSAFMENLTSDRGFKEISRLNKGWKPGEAYMNPDETRHTLIARLRLDGSELDLELLPCRIDDDSIPRVAVPGSDEHAAVLAYLREISEEAGLSTDYVLGSNGAIQVRDRASTLVD